MGKYNGLTLLLDAETYDYWYQVGVEDVDTNNGPPCKHIFIYVAFFVSFLGFNTNNEH